MTTNKNIINALLVSSLALGGAFTLSSCFSETDKDNNKVPMGTHHVVLNEQNVKINHGYESNENTFTVKNDFNKDITFGYVDCMSPQKETAFTQMRSSKGMIYNLTPLSYITKIEVEFITFSENPDDQFIYVSVGNSSNPTENPSKVMLADGFIELEANKFDYFTLKAGKANNVVSLDITYQGKDSTPIDPKPDTPDPDPDKPNPEPDPDNPNPDPDPDKPGPDPDTPDPKPETPTNKTVTLDLRPDEGAVPGSYNPTGNHLVYDGVNFMGQQFCNDYSGGVAMDHIVLRENGNGMITNLNALEGLSSIGFTGAVNSSSLKVYASNEFNTNWKQININNAANINLNDNKYFKITTSNDPFGFTSMNINFNTSNTVLNDFYKVKNVDELVDEAQAKSLIKISSQPFTNTQEWIDKGYARNISDAQNKTSALQQSGFNGNVDYLLPYNPDVIYNSKLQAYRVVDMNYGDNGNSFRINMLDGSVGPVIYKDGIYTAMEDIAAYITAFGNVPANMRYTKGNINRAINDWGINGRVNYTYYSNDTNRFKFEAEVNTHRQYFNPTNNSTDYWYHYFENDIGVTWTNDEPAQIAQARDPEGYPVVKYNDGQTIARGVLRFVWTNSYGSEILGQKKTQPIENSYDRVVYYTFNHYNDFQQYLNYYGGWSLTGGNTYIGNQWNRYNRNNHYDKMPYLPLASIENINK